MENVNPEIITNGTGRKLRPLDVAKPEDYKLIFLPPEAEIHEPEPDDDDASAVLGWAFWALLVVLPMIALYLMGLTVGSGN